MVEEVVIFTKHKDHTYTLFVENRSASLISISSSAMLAAFATRNYARSWTLLSPARWYPNWVSGVETWLLLSGAPDEQGRRPAITFFVSGLRFVLLHRILLARWWDAMLKSWAARPLIPLKMEWFCKKKIPCGDHSRGLCLTHPLDLTAAVFDLLHNTCCDHLFLRSTPIVVYFPRKSICKLCTYKIT